MEEFTFDYQSHYQWLHEHQHKWFSGQIGLADAQRIAALVQKTGAKRLLDYGSGKGYQYLRDRIHEVWGGVLPHCYDIGVRQLRQRPEGPFDGIICTDMMEHIAEPDIHEVLGDIFSFVETGFVFFNISTRPAGKSFKDGTNVHLTIQPGDWWDEVLRDYQRPGLIIEASYEDFSSDDV